MSKIQVDWAEWRNFLSYGNKWQRMDYKEGINLIIGQDESKGRSNGAGKSAANSVIPFALFGQTEKGVPQDKIINWVNGKNCEVRLGFRKDGIAYELHRGLKPGILELKKDGVDVPKLSDKRIFQQELETDLIGMDFRASQIITFQNANNMVSLFKTKKEDKRRFIEKFFNLEVYSKLNDHVSTKLTSLAKKLADINHSIALKTQRIDDIDRELSSMVVPDIDSYKKRVDAYAEQLEVELRVLGMLREVEDLQSELDAWIIGKDELDARLAQKQKELYETKTAIATLNAEKMMIENRVKAIGDIEEKKDKLQKLREGLAKIPDLQWKKDELAESFRHFRIKDDLAKEERALVTARINELNKQKKTYEDKLKGVVTVCPTCQQPVNSEELRKHLDSDLNNIDTEMVMLGVKRATLDQHVNELLTEYHSLEEARTKIEQMVEMKTTVERRIAELSNVDELDAELKVLTTKYESLCEKTIIAVDVEVFSKQIADMGLEKGKIVDSIQTLREQLSKTKEVEESVKSCTELLRMAANTLKEQQAVYDVIEGQRQVKVATLSELKVEVESGITDGKKLEKMKDYLEYIKITLKDDNVKQYAISSIVPFLQQQTNHYLSVAGHSYYIELDAWLDGEIKGFGVGDCEFGNMSGGEGKTIDLALKFAMMDVARRQAGSYLDVLVLDELLDSSIDSFGLEKMMEIVKAKQREDNLKVFIVSHREEMDGYGVDRVYKVSKENGFSTIGEI